MNQFYFYSKQLIKLLDKNKEILEFINSVEEFRDQYIIKPQRIIDISNKSNNSATAMNILRNEINSKNREVLQVVRSIRPNKVYELINKLIIDLNLFDKSYNDENSLIESLKHFPELHTDAYSEKAANEIFELLDSSSRIIQSIKEAERKAKFILEYNTTSNKSIPLNYHPLRIGTDQDVPLIDEFILIFRQIEDLYNFVCYLYKIDKEDNPLIINHISTGSWYTELLGVKQVVISIENLLKGIGQFIRDMVTGKIQREKFQNKCLEAESFLRLLKIAEENGIKNPEVGLFKHLNPFVESLKEEITVLEINDQEILKIRKTERLTLSKRKTTRDSLVEKIRLSIEKGKETGKGKE